VELASGEEAAVVPLVEPGQVLLLRLASQEAMMCLRETPY
jgi:hypothetical protein